ncbi:MAG: 50S ribosomal protein L6 [Chlamydiota bacterium]|nr:50S ribosomal protein L6 [Chlamydiota bacterium]
MSRIGKQPISLPKGVEVTFKDGIVTVKGPKGVLTQKVHINLEIKVEENEVIVSVDEKLPKGSAFHGLYRSLINNMVVGVSNGFEKKLEMIGVGYRAAVKGKDLDLQVGFSHPTLLAIPEGIDVKVEKNTHISITGTDKQVVGQFAADIRALRPPEPYQGKGIRYVGEYVRRKAGKSASK